MVYPLWNIYARIKTVLSRNNSCTSSCPRSKCKNCITFSNTLDEKINLKIYKKFCLVMKIEIILAIFLNGVLTIHWQDFGWVYF